jgi:hypothetical protein
MISSPLKKYLSGGEQLGLARIYLRCPSQERHLR